MEPIDLQAIATLEDRLRRLTVDFRQSREFVRLRGRNEGETISMDMKDLVM